MRQFFFTLTAFLFSIVYASGQNTKSDTIHGQNPIKYKHYSIEYPQAAKENNIQGKVILSYDVDSTCAVINRKVVQGLGYGCDEAALKVLDKVQKDLKKEEKGKCNTLKNILLPLTFKMQ